MNITDYAPRMFFVLIRNMIPDLGCSGLFLHCKDTKGVGLYLLQSVNLLKKHSILTLHEKT